MIRTEHIIGQGHVILFWLPGRSKTRFYQLFCEPIRDSTRDPLIRGWPLNYMSTTTVNWHQQPQFQSIHNYIGSKLDKNLHNIRTQCHSGQSEDWIVSVHVSLTMCTCIFWNNILSSILSRCQMSFHAICWYLKLGATLTSYKRSTGGQSSWPVWWACRPRISRSDPSGSAHSVTVTLPQS